MTEPGPIRELLMPMRFMPGILAILALVVMPLAAFADSATTMTGSVEGRVFAADLSGPAAGLVVAAYEPDGKMAVQHTVTDPRGQFTLSGLPVGDYVLVLGQEGTPVAKAQVTTSAGTARRVSLALPQLAPAAAQDDDPAGDAGGGGGGGGLVEWITKPLGAAVSLVIAAIVVSVGADQLTDSDPVFIDLEPPATPSEPGGGS